VTTVETGDFATLLRGYRRRAGLSQEELADTCGLSNRAISDLERRVSRPRQKTLRRLGEVLGLSAAELAGLAEASLTSMRCPRSPPHEPLDCQWREVPWANAAVVSSCCS
jgi:transcriptional regulator with XRE-family HTH domain